MALVNLLVAFLCLGVGAFCLFVWRETGDRAPLFFAGLNGCFFAVNLFFAVGSFAGVLA